MFCAMRHNQLVGFGTTVEEAVQDYVAGVVSRLVDDPDAATLLAACWDGLVVVHRQVIDADALQTAGITTSNDDV